MKLYFQLFVWLLVLLIIHSPSLMAGLHLDYIPNQYSILAVQTWPLNISIDFASSHLHHHMWPACRRLIWLNTSTACTCLIQVSFTAAAANISLLQQHNGFCSEMSYGPGLIKIFSYIMHGPLCRYWSAFNNYISNTPIPNTRKRIVQTCMVLYIYCISVVFHMISYCHNIMQCYNSDIATAIPILNCNIAWHQAILVVRCRPYIDAQSQI